MKSPGIPLPRFAFVSVIPGNIILTAVKKPTGLGRRGMMFRVFESFGKEVDAKFRFPWPVLVRKSDVLEKGSKITSEGEREFSVHLKP